MMHNEQNRSDHTSLNVELEALKTRNSEIVSQIHTIDKQDISASTSAIYYELKREQALIVHRIEAIQNQLTSAIKVKKDYVERISVGKRIELFDYNNDLNIFIEIVDNSPDDANDYYVSADSELGQALLDKVHGDEITVESSSGVNRYCVVKILQP